MIPWREIVAGFAVVGAIVLFMAAVIALAAWGAHKAIQWAGLPDERVTADEKILAERQEVERSREAAIQDAERRGVIAPDSARPRRTLTREY